MSAFVTAGSAICVNGEASRLNVSVVSRSVAVFSGCLSNADCARRWASRIAACFAVSASLSGDAVMSGLPSPGCSLAHCPQLPASESAASFNRRSAYWPSTLKPSVFFGSVLGSVPFLLASVACDVSDLKNSVILRPVS